MQSFRSWLTVTEHTYYVSCVSSSQSPNNSYILSPVYTLVDSAKSCLSWNCVCCSERHNSLQTGPAHWGEWIRWVSVTDAKTEGAQWPPEDFSNHDFSLSELFHHPFKAF